MNNNSESKLQSGSKHILVALDGSKNAERALLYVADFIGGFSGIRVTLLRIISRPPEDYFETPAEHDKWIKEQSAIAEAMLENYRQILIQAGFEENMVSTMVTVCYCKSIAECILEHQQKLACCTVVIGRRAISRKEEFLFGSTSGKLMRSTKHCAVWIIE